MTTTSLDVKAVREREEKATPGPWKFNDNGVVTADASGKIVCCFVMAWARIPDGEDWDFLSNARSDIPALLAEIDRLSAKNAETADERGAALETLWEIANSGDALDRELAIVVIRKIDHDRAYVVEKFGNT